MNAERSRSEERPIPLSATAEHGALNTEARAKSEASPIVLETCHSTWVFDEENHRFRRSLKGPVRERVSTEWRPYDHLVVVPDEDAFLVFLDRHGTRVLRSTHHVANCQNCGDQNTAELSLEDLRALLAS